MKGSIRRRGNDTWEINIHAGTGADGKRLRKFYYVRGDEDAAERRLRELLTQLDHGLDLPSETITVAEWLDRWLSEQVTHTTRQRTQERYQAICRKYIVPHLGQIRLAKLTPSAIKSFEARLLRDGTSPQLTELVHIVLSGALKHALRMEVIWRNPAKAVTPPKVPRKEVVPPDLESVRRVLAQGLAERHPLHPALHLISYTGIRRGECLGLVWTHVDLDRGSITITQSIARSSQKGIIVEPTKTESGRRTLDIDPDTAAVLRAHRVRQLEERLKVGKHYHDRDLVFADAIGRPANPMLITRTYQALAKRAGVPRGRLHDLRHFHASLLFAQGESPVLVQQRLGHKSLATTADIYGHLFPGHQKDAAAKFARKMRGQK